MFIKALEYETVNPEQDATSQERRIFDPTTGEKKRAGSDLHASRYGQVSAASTGPPVTNGNTAHVGDDNIGYHRGPGVEADVGSLVP